MRIVYQCYVIIFLYQKVDVLWNLCRVLALHRSYMIAMLCTNVLNYVTCNYDLLTLNLNLILNIDVQPRCLL